ncbi:hypothetical protein [Sphingobacterium hungaricum]|uniref:Uncharacterized protein n=1 Tax=Sphingobacterium hungaricum TaxID=2082723 RepID=A0A928UYW3_9SPHI|nr:hypothetical protein [Sphingobacterium hungaricum]MBE8713342.1 hypothetical protein [Sphingobacterium hungaricum]
MEHSKFSRLILVFYFGFLFYSIGALAIENDVNYKSWYFIGNTEFKKYHIELEKLLKLYLFLPLGFTLLLNVFLLFMKLARSFKTLFLISFFLLLFILIFSVLVQVPIHVQLQNEYRVETLNLLISNHQTFRLIPTLFLAMVNLIILYKYLTRK